MNNYFCVLPFFSAEISPHGVTTPCCLLPKDTDIKELQNDILAKRRSPACQKCWDLEDQGKVSDRQLKNSAFDFYTDRDINLIEQDCRHGESSTKIVKLYTSNLCNSTCVTCGPYASTAWATLKNVKVFDKIEQTVFDSLDYKNFVMLNFVGGEPLKEKKNFDVLYKLIAARNTDCFVSFTTNGSVPLTEQQKDILKQFKNLNICLSIDGINKRFEYMRYPLSWDQLLKNIDFFRNNRSEISVSYTISNVNIFYYAETIKWFIEQGFNYNHNIISNPKYFAPSALPKHVKEQLNKDIISLGKHTNLDDENFVLACQEIKLQDSLKKIHIKDYMPEFYNIIPTDLR